MKVLIQAAKIYNSTSAFHLQRKDILIENGVVVEISDDIKDEEAEKIQGNNLKVSSGWFDLFSVVREPGNENKDTIKTLTDSALLGGFTDLAGVSGSDPSLYNRSQVEFLKNRTAGSLLNIHPLGTITEKKEGENITEMYDLHLAGVAAFSDGRKHINNPELLKRALLYVKPFGGKIMVYSEDQSLANGGMVNEGVVAANLGMKVRPAVAEVIAIERNLKIANYADASIHFQAISSKESVELIRQAKANGMKVSCDVQLANILFTDEKINSFNTNYKVLPVLRTEEDRQALLKGLKDGTIDAITSGHTPQDGESKDCEFDHAAFGITSLETMGVSMLEYLSEDLGEEKIYKLLSESSKKVIGLPPQTLSVGESASVTVVDDASWKFERKHVSSVSKNNPLVGSSFSQQVVAVLNKGLSHFNA